MQLVNKMQRNYLILLILLNSMFAAQAAFAKEPLWLTSTDQHGDCISWHIYSPKTAFERDNMDKPYCTDNNLGDADKINSCIENASQQQTVRSFLNFCGNGITYIGLNGQTFALKRLGSAPKQHPFLVGRYIGKNTLGQKLLVEIKQTRLVTKSYQDDTSTADDNILEYKSEVMMTIKSGNQTQKFKGLLDESI